MDLMPLSASSATRALNSGSYLFFAAFNRCVFGLVYCPQPQSELRHWLDFRGGASWCAISPYRAALSLIFLIEFVHRFFPSPSRGAQTTIAGGGEVTNRIPGADLQTFTFVPESSSSLLFSLGALGTALRRRR